jgi:hypothetical protein
MPNSIPERMELTQDKLVPREVDNSEMVSVYRDGKEVRTHIVLPVPNIESLETERPINLALTYNINVDARIQVNNDNRVVRNSESNTTVASGDNVLNTIGNIISGLLNF